MNRPLLLVVVATVFAAFTSTPSHADTLFSQPSNATAYSSIFDQSYSGSYSIYDDFTLSSTSSITSLVFEGLYSGLSKPSFTVNIYSSVNGKPGTKLASNSISNAGLVSVYDSSAGDYTISAALSPFLATGGTKYFISIVGSSSSQFGWAESDTGAYDSYYARGTSTNYQANGSNLAFTLNGTPVGLTPEPSGLLLVGTGLLTFGGVARYRFRRT